MIDEDDTAAAVRRLAITLSVLVRAFYDQAHSPAGNNVSPAAITDLIPAFTLVGNPAERQRCLNLLKAEAQRLRGLSDDEFG